ncbi:hypothetical protein TRV_04713 [Trichophyton verrucosum HKI 0517]|uniref:Uncharacterized protein n=1 Tax=Trichophyton verrucosum (strain HKI 0517) TaxID=663202 RepID=D4DC61_TRIVH|nr:uncharacterized protein TRV_04713 [Trichophyton verrucosum HKI 0517]EFE40578.1 hypothetical protein TRV_04713 [Trichophyton verrucosum HKI 0517]
MKQRERQGKYGSSSSSSSRAWSVRQQGGSAEKWTPSGHLLFFLDVEDGLGDVVRGMPAETNIKEPSPATAQKDMMDTYLGNQYQQAVGA